ncbi:autotransporter outer membrane beta-barrel domain-containing protein [Fusobacterium hwasookii]|uniref:Autotransporter n=1 Tax=Fusobacterium hwasookii ChDC F206 TaxID=1307443 RepID=A0AAC9F0Y6_9FUSO|nr:autotransporter outer membrane beta-barrel domain-containing protein [Fusobacterium hwasookii]ALQ34687.1 autotransporter [Fusobacterium hwasookii ChDC F206]ALQ38569.1 autotransporter [Fusobacterium hwasookii ChDC F300]QNE68970.1 autotransporter outer membrane beta-barrel domain-containing protein [Fusobacterium hwasookii]
MKNSKKVFGLFAFLLVCGNVNAGSVGAPERYPGIRYDYNNVNVSLPAFNFTENLTDGGNYIRVEGNSTLDIASNLDINLTSNIPSTGAYGNLVGFGAYGTNNGAPTINAKDVKIKVEVGAADYHNEPFGMLIRDGANYSGGNIDINLITNSNHSGSDITALSYGADDENVTREYNSTMKVKDVNIKMVNNQVLTSGLDDNGLIGLEQMGDKNQNTNFVSTGNLNIDIDDKSNSAPYHIAAGIVIEGSNGTKMTLNNSNIKIKSKANNDYVGGAIVLGFPDYEATTTGQGATLESKGKMVLDTTEAPDVATLNLHGHGSLFKADFENSSAEIKSGGTAIRFAGISQALNADGEDTKPGRDLTISLKNAKITTSATAPHSAPLIVVEDGVKNATFNLSGPGSIAKAAEKNNLLSVKGNADVTLNISDGAKASGTITRGSSGEITTNITNNAVWSVPANSGSTYSSNLTLKNGGTFNLSDESHPHASGINYYEIKVFSSKTDDGKLVNDNGVITMANTSYNDEVEIYGNYEGKNGAKIKMNTLWNAPGDADGTNSKSDILKILQGGSSKLGNATGVTEIVPVALDGRVNIIEGNIKKVAQAVNTVPVVVADKAAAGTFVGTAQTTGAGEVQLTSKLNSNGQRVFFWTLNALDGTNPYDDGTSKNYSSRTTILNSSVAGYINTAKVNMDSGFTSLSTLHERRGENALDVNNKKGQAWARIIGQHSKDEGKERFNYETDIYGVQAGYDFNIKNSEDGNRYTGFYFTNTTASTDFYDRYRAENGIIASDKYTGKVKTKDFSFGLTTTKYYNNGFYLDLVGQLSFINNKYNSRDGVSAKQRGNALAFSVEGGKNYGLGSNWTIEPQAQLIYQYLNLKDFNDGVREVHYGNDSALRARLGFRTTYKKSFYSIANVWHDFSNTTEANIGSDVVKEKYSATWGEIGLGVQLPITNSAYVYSDVRYERSFTSNPKHNGYRGTVGFKYTF